jgi:hypothetical protein
MVRRYVETLHDTVREVGGRFFTPDRAKQLLHNSLVPARITCYVSTNFGVAVEYSSAPRTTIESRRGSARVEDLIFQAPSRLKDVGPMFRIAGSNTAIIGLVLADAFPMRLNTEDADVTLRNVSFACDALRWKRKLEYAELYGSRRASRWSSAAAQSRAKDEILAALFLAQRADKFSTKLEEYVASFRRKTVLVLGSYDPEGKRRLQSIAAALEQTGYEPVLVEDIPEFEHYDLSQKVVAIGAVSRFIVIDDSTPSGHLAEVELCRTNRWVTAILRADARGASWMTAGASITSNVMLEAAYDPESPQSAVDEATRWAEARLAELKNQLDALYPWRMES